MADQGDRAESDTEATPAGRRSVHLERTSLGHYDVRNARGGVISFGDGSGEDFTPVETLLAAIAACASVDVDHMTSRRADPTQFSVVASGTKVTDDDGNHMEDIEVIFDLAFGDGPDGDAARARIGAAIRASHDRDCTVSRTVERPTPVTMRTAT